MPPRRLLLVLLPFLTVLCPLVPGRGEQRAAPGKIGLPALPVPSNLMGIYNGEEFVFEESSWYIINVLKLLWHYGFSPLRMNMWVEDILDKFMRIYRYQTHDYTFSTYERLFHALGGNDFIQMFNQTIDEAMQKASFSQKFINEMVCPAMRVDYGQGVNINGFVGAVSLAGAGSGLWSVKGGNKLVCTGLIYASKADVIAGTVVSIQPNPYQQTVATFVHGRLNASFFGYRDPSAFHLGAIFTTENPKLFINSVGIVSPVENRGSEVKPPLQSAVWKIFSREVLTKEQLNLLFSSYDSVKVKKWLAYPHYSPPNEFPPIILHDNIYYLNGIEWAASAMEMSSIAAKNAALLAYHRWYSNTDKIDQEDLYEKLKTEL